TPFSYHSLTWRRGAVVHRSDGCLRSSAFETECLARRACWPVSSASCCASRQPTQPHGRRRSARDRARAGRRRTHDSEIQMIPDTRTHPRLLAELARVPREDPVGRKLVSCPRPPDGRELLHFLAPAGVAWGGGA